MTYESERLGAFINDLKSYLRSPYLSGTDADLYERILTLAEIIEVDRDALLDRIKDLESNEKALQRKLRVLMPDRSNDI
jgi:hypothetical protein